MWLISIKSTVIIFLGTIVYGLIAGNKTSVWPIYLLWLVGLYVGQYDYKKLHHNRMSYRKGIQLGLMITLILSLGTSLLTYLHFTVLEPQIIPDMIDQIARELRQEDPSGAMEVWIQRFQRYVTPFNFACVSMIYTLIVSTFMTLLLTLFTRSAETPDTPTHP